MCSAAIQRFRNLEGMELQAGKRIPGLSTCPNFVPLLARWPVRHYPNNPLNLGCYKLGTFLRALARAGPQIRHLNVSVDHGCQIDSRLFHGLLSNVVQMSNEDISNGIVLRVSLSRLQSLTLSVSLAPNDELELRGSPVRLVDLRNAWTIFAAWTSAFPTKTESEPTCSTRSYWASLTSPAPFETLRLQRHLSGVQTLQQTNHPTTERVYCERCGALFLLAPLSAPSARSDFKQHRAPRRKLGIRLRGLGRSGKLRRLRLGEN